jgi:riboflavin biosynthesis pyrimidine reductase
MGPGASTRRGANGRPMSHTLLRLHPGPREEVELRGLYLRQELHRRGGPEAPFVYADFVSSLDGRIAIADRLPAELMDASDLRLLLELQAQADCVITHAGYLRAIAEGRLGDILEIGATEQGRDLRDWRTGSGLPEQPAVAIASASLDFPMPPSLAGDASRVVIATTRSANAAKRRAWESRGYRVLVAGEGRWVEGGPLTRALGALGHRSMFLLAGPRMLETMLRDRMLSRLYLTIVHRLLGGEAPQTAIAGPELRDTGRLRLEALYQDAAGPDGVGQWFAAFEPER